MIGIPVVSNMQLIYYTLFFLFLILFAIYDIQHRRVPDLALACFLPFILLAIPIRLIAGNELELMDWFYPILGFLVGGGTLLMAAISTNGGIGGGDIKLTAMLGFVYGPYGILFALFFATPFAMLFGLFEQRRTGNRFIYLPFVPFLVIGCCAATVLKL